MSDTEIDKLSTRLAGSVATAADKVALAIPGERYSRLIEDAHGSDPEKKAAAQAYVKSLFGVSIDESFLALAYFRNVPQSTSLRFDMFWVPTGTREEVEHYIADLNLNLRNPCCVSPPSTTGAFTWPAAALSWSISQDPVLVIIAKEADVKTLQDLRVHVGMFKRELVEAEQARQNGTRPLGAPMMLPPGVEVPPPIASSVGLKGLDFVTFHQSDFLPAQAVSHPVHGVLRYAVHNMVGSALISQDVVRKYSELREAEKKWREVHSKAP